MSEENVFLDVCMGVLLLLLLLVSQIQMDGTEQLLYSSQLNRLMALSIGWRNITKQPNGIEASAAASDA